jgi:hypothetical protein
MPDGYPGEMTQEEIEERLLYEFVQATTVGTPAPVTIPQETAELLAKIVLDAGKGKPPKEKDK